MSKNILVILMAAVAFFVVRPGRSQAPNAAQSEQAAARAAFRQYCLGCHSAQVKSGGVVINPDALGQVGENGEVWEKVVRQLRAELMPPPGAPRPSHEQYVRLATFLETRLDAEAAARPKVGDLPQLHRLTRTEYKNAIRDLLGLSDLPQEMDYTTLLPADNVSSGFDNIADLLYISPPVMERYLEAARKISRLAVGDMQTPVMVNIHTMPVQHPQDAHVEGLPLGTRGGAAIRAYFPLDATYEVKVDTSGAARDSHLIEISVDGERMHTLTVGGPGGRGGRGGGPGVAGGNVANGPGQAGFNAGPRNVFRLPVTAGPHLIGVTFAEKTEALDEAVVKPRTRSRGTQPAIGQITISGPFEPTGPGDTPARRRIFVCQPQAGQEAACARKILSTLMRRAYKRPVNDEDLADLMPFYEAGRAERSFDYGIQRAIERLLVSPQFLYRIERERTDVPAGTAYPVSDLELASRLSFFLWSSIPDDELLELAAVGRLRQPGVLEQQVRRMLADPRSESLVTNFAAQWLFLRDLQVKEADLFLFRDFDEVLKKDLVRETELFLDSILRQERPLTDLITANYTFLNERLAKHYEIPGIQGSHFRKVTFPEGSPRGGLLGQASILTITSYSTRTSPVVRGKYILENLLASPPPPPPPNVPSLKTEGKSTDEPLSMREAMTLHRQNPACAGCHAKMDPIGFSMENFDAVGRWRDVDAAGKPIDAATQLVDGTKFTGVDGLKAVILKDPERFISAITEKLMMYALGRNVQYYDAPAVRAVVRDAASRNYTFASLVEGIVKSRPFQMRATLPVRNQ
jgi:mono/diheme cytochrome c family protein